MKKNIVAYTQAVIKALETEKQNAVFFEENKQLLTMTLKQFFNQAKCGIENIPVEEIFQHHNFEHSRETYVFDLIGLSNGSSSSFSDSEKNSYFLTVVEKALKQFGLSTTMDMTPEQRNSFDEIVRQIESEKGITVLIDSIKDWHRIVKRITFSNLPESAIEYLSFYYDEKLLEITSEVMEKTNKLKEKDSLIEKYISDALTARGLNLFQLREFNWEDVEKYKKNKSRKKSNN